MRDPQKILIVRFSSLGDVILASQLIRALRTRFPHAQIDFLVKSAYSELLRFNPRLSSVIELRSGSFGELADTARKIRLEKYDLLLDIQNNFRSRYVRLMARARMTRVVNKREVRRFLLVRFHWNLYRKISTVPERYLETIAGIAPSDDCDGPELFVPEHVATAMTSLLARSHLDRCDAVVGIAPGARHFTKRWPLERFVELGVLLGRTGQKGRVKILVFGSREEKDYCGDIAQMINLRLESPAAENMAGQFSLLETAAALDRCTLVVSNDSGLMHVAAARRRNLVAVFGSTVRELGFFPPEGRSIVVETSGLPCRPCSHIGLEKCPKGHFKCMKEITADEVVKASARFLN